MCHLQPVHMVTFDWLGVPLCMKVGLRCASTIPGGQCVTIHGTTLMQPSFANNWDMHILAVSVLCLSVKPTVYLVIVVYFHSWREKKGYLLSVVYASNLCSIVFICKHSNYSYSPGGQALVNAYFGQGTGQIVLDNVRCTGSENQLLSCSSATILDVSSSCDHSDDAGVRCEGIHYVKCS